MLPYNQDHHFGKVAENATMPPTLDEAIERSQDFLLSLQYPEGYWWAELEANVTLTAQTIMLYKILGIDHKYPIHKMKTYILRTQRAHGGWEIFYGDGGCLSTTIEAYMALRILGVPKTDPVLQKALKLIHSKGGVTKSRMFTKICLALLGCYDWKGIPSLPPWLVLLPSWFPFSLYDTASWVRGCVVPLTIIFDKKPVYKLNPLLCLDELYSEGKGKARVHLSFIPGDWTSNFFVGLDHVFKYMENLGVVPFRQWGIKEAERWTLERHEDSGDFHGIYPPMFYSIVSYSLLGYEITDPVVHRALESMRGFTVEREDECVVQSCISPMWDTAFVIRSLAESGLQPDHPALQKAGEWLLQKQATQHGDWFYKKRTGRAGGWAFQFFNRWYPDVDDSAAVSMALNAIKLQDDDVKKGAIKRCAEWISVMQCKDGGWAAYDCDNDREWLNCTPFGDLKAMIDPNTVDVTARVLEMVGRVKEAGDASAILPPRAIARGLAYLRREQETEGCWYGRWGVNYIYGTSGALMALALVAPSTHKEEIERGARWLVEVQNKRGTKGANGYSHTNGAREGGVAMNGNCKNMGAPEDGGWGETCFSYNDITLKGRNEVSTVSQTAWALQGLLAAGDALGKYEVESIEHGVQYLLSTQRKDGSWCEKHFTGGGFPRFFYIRYHLYAGHFPLSALARYRDRVRAGKMAK
ncbi:hypothetical protein GOP47_0026175 [Adiantum capillus-veneris]|nr:hypothetical protein GOP47_0026175 [Adiantum capillus-veneris]